MKNSRRVYILIETVLAVMLVLVAAAMLREQGERKPDRIAVILQEPDAGRWAAFKYGLRAAAEDAGVEVLIVSAEGQFSAAGEENMLERDIVDGADAVILQPVPGIGTENLLAIIGDRMPVMLVGCPSFGEEGKFSAATTGPDNYAMGAALAEELLADFGESLAEKKIGILSEMADSRELQERENGFRETLQEDSTVVWSVNSSEQESGEALLEEQTAVDMVICLDDSSLVAAGKRAAAGNLHGALVYGIGHSTEAVYYLDLGNVECLVVPDEFNVGYQSLTEVARRLGSRFYKMKNIVISHTVLYRETLFSEENQELLFTMSQ